MSHPAWDDWWTAEDLREFCRGRVKIEALRANGLRGAGQGYWGENVRYSLSRFFCRIPAERDRVSDSEREHEAIFDNLDSEGNQWLDSDPAPRRVPVSARRSAIQSSPNAAREMGRVVAEFERATTHHRQRGNSGGRAHAGR